MTSKTSRIVDDAESDLQAELLEAERDFARGDFIELTIEQLDRCIAAGEWPWPDDSSE